MPLENEDSTREVEQCDEIDKPGSLDDVQEGQETNSHPFLLGDPTSFSRDDADNIFPPQGLVDPLLLVPPVCFG